MFIVAIRKMIKNKWLIVCLFLGSLLSVSLMTSMPVYSRAILQRMLIKGYEQRRDEIGAHPLNYTVRYAPFRNDPVDPEHLNLLDRYAIEYYYGATGLPCLTYRKSMYINTTAFIHVGLYGDENDKINSSRMSVVAHSDIKNNINIIHGREPRKAEGEYEVIATTAAMHSLRLSLDSRYRLTSFTGEDGGPLILRVVGIFEPKDRRDAYWFGATNFNNFVYMDPDVFYPLISSQPRPIYTYTLWEFALDFNALTVENVESVMTTIKTQMDDKSKIMRVSTPHVDVFETYAARQQQLSIFLSVLMVPIVALLIFYIVMISSLIFEYDKNERTLMKSRGAGRLKIFSMYVYQSVIIAVFALAAGVPLSMYLCEIIGSANGFLEFVGRTPLKAVLTRESFIYALAGVLVFLLAMLLPILFSREDSIVDEKRRRARSTRPFFEKYFLDVILLAVAFYGMFDYENTSAILTKAGVTATEMPMNPALFLISTVFIFGCGLFFTRVYPYFIKLLFAIGRNAWPPGIYASLISVSRTRSRSRFLMVFLVLTVSLGIFSSAAARTINRNYEDRIMYGVGADIRMKEEWPSVDPDPQYGPGMEYKRPPDKDMLFSAEPSFEKYLDLEGVADATKVYINDRAVVMKSSVNDVHNVNVMCVVPHEFSNIAWSRSDLYPYHINHMMNAMTANPYTVLLSESLMRKLNLSRGDMVNVTWENNPGSLLCVVYDSIKYFPTYDPTDIGKSKAPPNLIIMNYELVRQMFRLEPYEVWISVKDGYSSSDIYRQLVDDKVKMLYFLNASSDIVRLKNDPLVQGMNGNLTLSFVITIIITAAGFMIFWIFDLKSRQLQVGIIRSMGMSSIGVIGMLLWEQALMSLVPMLAGLLIGNLSAMIFVPMFEFGVSIAQTVPPFKVFILRSDYLRVGAIVAVIMLFAIAALGFMMSRLKISQTLKLGED